MHDLNVDNFCSRYFKYRDLFFAGETYQRFQPSNVPGQEDTWSHYADLATKVLDPVREHFGALTITYGFSGPELYKLIPGRISPKLDQHAGSEISNGKLICSRNGAAVDFFCPEVNSIAVAQWIAENLCFDRMYLYGFDKPIHVSLSAMPKQAIYFLKKSPGTGLRVPRKLKTIDLKALFND
jgi:hypothetical protein